jgi:magnesium transporter
MKKEMFNYEVSVLRNTFRRLLRRNAHTNLTKIIRKTHPADLAVLFRYFTDTEQKTLFDLMIEKEHTAEFLTELDEVILVKILENEDPGRIATIFYKLGSNDQAEILNLLSEPMTNSILELLQKEDKKEVEEIMSYPEDSAGSMMSTDVFTLHKNTIARDAIQSLQDKEEAEMVFYLYVTDDDDRLVGVISLRDLVTTPPDKTLDNIMIKNVISVQPETDQEEVAKIVSRYNYLAVPVIDLEEHMLGIVTVDDVVDVIREEATEDFLQMAGAGKDREILLKSSWGNARARLPWLFASWVGGVAAVAIIGVFKNMLETTVALAAFIPVIIGMGGNIGTQSSTIIVRGLATGRVDIGNNLKIILKEIKVGLILGVLYGMLLGIFATLKFVNTTPYLGLIVALSILSSMIISPVVGTLVPLLFRKLNIDPAIATGPFVTTSIDIIGVTLYFLIASALIPV